MGHHSRHFLNTDKEKARLVRAEPLYLIKDAILDASLIMQIE